jgi:hypothetical protein
MINNRWEWDVLKLQFNPNNDVVAEESFDNLESLTGKGDETDEEKEKPKESTKSTPRMV